MVAGGMAAQRLFSSEAVRHIARLSRGVPRIINLLCDRALLGAYVEGASVVSLNIARKAAREVLQTPGSLTGVRTGRSRVILQVAVLVVLGVCLPLLYYYRATVNEAAARIIMRMDSYGMGRAGGTPDSNGMAGASANRQSSPLITIGKLEKIAGVGDEMDDVSDGTGSGGNAQMRQAGESPE
jgi:general secretion pathway protein A